MKRKNRPITPFRRRLWWVYGAVVLSLWLVMVTVMLVFTERTYDDPTPSFSNPISTWTPAPISFATNTPLSVPTTSAAVATQPLPR
jgi:hypothetical protein